MSRASVLVPAIVQILISSCSIAMAQQVTPDSVTLRKLRSVADFVLKNADDQLIDAKTGKRYNSYRQAPQGVQLQLASPFNDWRYWNGVLNIGMIEAGKSTGDSAYVNFAVRNFAFIFDNYDYFRSSYAGQDKWSYPFGQRITMSGGDTEKVLDDYGAMTASLVEVFNMSPDMRYRNFIDSAGACILTKQDRLDDGTLVRPSPRKWTLWADDLYMSVSFLSRMGKLTGDNRYFDDAARQVINFHKYLYDPRAGLSYHCWFSDSMKNGVAFWGRANGWMLLAQIDLLERLPDNYPEKDKLRTIFREVVSGIARYQDGTGLWHQLLDRPDSFCETSCSAMFTYAIARGILDGLLDAKYRSIAELGWEGIITKIRDDGQIEDVCTGTGIGDDLSFYYHRPTPLNDPHGIGAVLLAGAEILRLGK